MKLFGRTRSVKDLTGREAPRPPIDYHRLIAKVTGRAVIIIIGGMFLVGLFPDSRINWFMAAHFNTMMMILFAFLALGGVSELIRFMERNR